MKKMRLTALGIAVASIAGCGGGGSSSPETTESNNQTGRLVDSPVVNIGYRTETQEGVTNANGEFEYADGETVTFFIGGLEFPPVNADGVVTPLDLAGTQDTSDSTAVNMIRLLQTLDEDGDTSNGITISAAAKAAATQVDFSLSEADFESSTVVTNLVANSGSTNTSLISTNEAISHFEGTLSEENVEFIANANISGLWKTDLTDNDLLAFIFFEDGTYVHLEVDQAEPIDEAGEVSGMEWGTYSRAAEDGKLTVSQTFDENGSTGLTDFNNGSIGLFAQVSGDLLTLQFDDNQNQTIDAGESLDFTRQSSSELLGVWTTELTDNDLLTFAFFDDGTYVHLEIDEEAPIDSEGEESGMEWGEYSRDSETGQMTINIVFDSNGGTGLNDFAEGASDLYAQVSGDVLTLQFDDNLNGQIESGESLDFQRQ